ncbi:NAC domain-containing protein 78 isoform X1 [Nicotiana tabacum]|uniref:NAC domain-containing protein 78 isoform X1 n=2 Tax=Nicotiana TaxID=4085 RepID=A0A1S3YQZ9_TOBAC|nr:PREDICTED: NAC domain-containing protein 78-like isoform X1 [Nicotiana sylvestris]XP_016454400.1 PREDICTED: NAC domain-containing protein 78-like isoform X1 [Nicotiana tabacum]
MESRGSLKSLAPGFRFHPTDEELVRYYLRRKITGRPIKSAPISDIDIYKVEPWDLPGKSRLKTRDLEWYFFSVLDKKYGNGARTNRATEKGYWKTTGKDRAVHRNKSQVVGMKKTLVYHSGRAPKGQRTNWVMHEYRLIDEELDRAGIPQDAFVVCRVFQKSGAGPKNGEQYGAPFIEEEWEEDELQVLPKDEAAEEFVFDDDIYLDGIELDQILGTETTLNSAPLPLDYCYGENGSSEETNNSSDAQNWLQQPDELKPIDLAVQQNVDVDPVMHEYIGESSKNVNSEDVDYLLHEPTVNATDDLQFKEEAFLEANDLSNPIEVDSSGFDMLEEYLTFFDANDDFQHMGFDPSVLFGNDDQISDQALLAEKNIGEVTQQFIAPNEGLGENKNDFASSSKLEPTKFGSDRQYPFMKKASQMLGNIHAPPAFASEFPTKDATLRLNSLSQSSSSVQVTAGFQIRDTTVGSNGTGWPLGKYADYNIILSFGISRRSDDSAMESFYSIHPGKTTSIISRGWFYYLFFSFLMLCMSFKIGTIICAS